MGAVVTPQYDRRSERTGPDAQSHAHRNAGSLQKGGRWQCERENSLSTPGGGDDSRSTRLSTGEKPRIRCYGVEMCSRESRTMSFGNR